jgi:hypothetical protein
MPSRSLRTSCVPALFFTLLWITPILEETSFRDLMLLMRLQSSWPLLWTPTSLL